MIRDETGLAVDYRIDGDFPKFGNADPRVDDLAVDLVSRFMAKIRKHRPIAMRFTPSRC